MEIIMKEVESSNIARIGWVGNVIYGNGSTPKDVLRVEFSYGAVYDYINVPKEVYEELLNAESIGAYLNRQIKEKYQTIKEN